jgi:hypothetical protein
MVRKQDLLWRLTLPLFGWRFQPVEKLVELKTDFRMSFRKNRSVGSASDP